MSSCVWTAAHVDKDGDQSQRGKDGQLDWAQSPRKSCTLLHDSIHQQLQVKGVRLYALCFVSWRQMPSPSNIRQHSGAGANFLFRGISRVPRTLRHRRKCPFEWKIFPVHAHYDRTSPGSRRDDGRRDRNSAARFSGPRHLHVDVQRHSLDKERQQRHLLPKNVTSVSTCTPIS